MKGHMKIEEVAVRLGVSTQTINRWYRFKRQNPEHQLSKLLPEYTKEKTAITGADVRYWNQDDLFKFIEFQSHVKLGRTGVMGKYDGRGTRKEQTDVTNQT